MQRPTILNRLITLHARRISPTRPARLVGPSRLLRRDKVRSPHTNGPRDQSPECEVLVAIAVAITQSATSNPFQPPKQWAPGSSRIPVRRSCHDDYCVIQPDIPSSVHFPDVPCGSLAPLISTAFTSWLRGAKEESKGPKRFGEFIRDACHRKGPSIRFEGQNGPRRNSQLAECSLRLNEDPAAGRI
jgi:hypothetical protein